MNYGVLKNKPGVFVPDMGIDYPTDDPFKRLLTVEVEDSSKGKYQFDETYPYLDNSLSYKLNDLLGCFVKWVLTGFWNRTHFGLQVKGRKKLKGQYLVLIFSNLSDSKRQQTTTVDYKRLFNGFFLTSVVVLQHENLFITKQYKHVKIYYLCPFN